MVPFDVVTDRNDMVFNSRGNLKAGYPVYMSWSPMQFVIFLWLIYMYTL